MTEGANEARREYLRKWRAANKDKIKANTARYWERKAKKAAEGAAAAADQVPGRQTAEGQPA